MVKKIQVKKEENMKKIIEIEPILYDAAKKLSRKDSNIKEIIQNLETFNENNKKTQIRIRFFFNKKSIKEKENSIKRKNNPKYFKVRTQRFSKTPHLFITYRKRQADDESQRYVREQHTKTGMYIEYDIRTDKLITGLNDLISNVLNKDNFELSRLDLITDFKDHVGNNLVFVFPSHILHDRAPLRFDLKFSNPKDRLKILTNIVVTTLLLGKALENKDFINDVLKLIKKERKAGFHFITQYNGMEAVYIVQFKNAANGLRFVSPVTILNPLKKNGKIYLKYEADIPLLLIADQLNPNKNKYSIVIYDRTENEQYLTFDDNLVKKYSYYVSSKVGSKM